MQENMCEDTQKTTQEQIHPKGTAASEGIPEGAGNTPKEMAAWEGIHTGAAEKWRRHGAARKETTAQ